MIHEELVAKLKGLLVDATAIRYRGELHVHKVRVQARADAYMEALLDAGLVERDEMLQLLSEVRAEQATSAAEQSTRVAAVG